MSIGVGGLMQTACFLGGVLWDQYHGVNSTGVLKGASRTWRKQNTCAIIYVAGFV